VCDFDGNGTGWIAQAELVKMKKSGPHRYPDEGGITVFFQ
jgi:hypothetical protein